MNGKEIKTFGIIGGDKRQLYLAKSLAENGFGVILGGFDKLYSTGLLLLANVEMAVAGSDAVIFPLPSVRTDGSINTPFSDSRLTLDGALLDRLKIKPMFVAMKDKFLRAYPELSGCEIYDYSARDDFATLNALPTAEGAIERAMNAYEATISGSRVMVAGFGRIGKLLANKLKSLGADVTVTARSSVDMAYAAALGYEAKNTNQLTRILGYDIVFNTIPECIFNAQLLENTDTDTLIIDLASLPGGVDFEAAHKLGVDARRALALPGKCSPKTAGEIIMKTVFSILEEVYG